MKSTEQLASVYLILIGLNACAQVNNKDLSFLVGTWKVENKLQFEEWKESGPGHLSGSVYKMTGQEKVVSEFLIIKTIDGEIIYEATVLNQNEGQTVPFTLNPEAGDWYSFENEDHDFPKKIRYLMVTNNELLVEVLGADGQGFSYKMFRQDS